MTKGFTLLEILLVVAIISILSYLAVPLGMNFYRSQTVEGARSELIETLTKARRNAVLMKGDSRYGVKIEKTVGNALSSFTIYKGDSYDLSRGNSDVDEVYFQVPGMTIAASGSAAILLDDINFSKLEGTTTATGTITITHDGGEARSVLIDSFGNAYRE